MKHTRKELIQVLNKCEKVGKIGADINNNPRTFYKFQWIKRKKRGQNDAGAANEGDAIEFLPDNRRYKESNRPKIGKQTGKHTHKEEKKQKRRAYQSVVYLSFILGDRHVSWFVHARRMWPSMTSYVVVVVSVFLVWSCEQSAIVFDFSLSRWMSVIG